MLTFMAALVTGAQAGVNVPDAVSERQPGGLGNKQSWDLIGRMLRYLEFWIQTSSVHQSLQRAPYGNSPVAGSRWVRCAAVSRSLT